MGFGEGAGFRGTDLVWPSCAIPPIGFLAICTQDPERPISREFPNLMSKRAGSRRRTQCRGFRERPPHARLEDELQQAWGEEPVAARRGHRCVGTAF